VTACSAHPDNKKMLSNPVSLKEFNSLPLLVVSIVKSMPHFCKQGLSAYELIPAPTLMMQFE
jgi:hypothetical protein